MNTWRLNRHNPRIITDDADHMTIASFLRQEDAAHVLQLEAESARLRDALERIADYGTVSGMHDQDRAPKLQQIAKVALKTLPRPTPPLRTEGEG